MYLWIKAFHLIAVITWFAALFYLPRLFVYHAMTEPTDTAGIERFKIMERKLLNGIMTPSMILVLIFGGWMLYLVPAWFSQVRPRIHESGMDARQIDFRGVTPRLPPLVHENRQNL